VPVPLPTGLDDVTLGRLEDLQRGGKGGMDPNGVGTARLASDVLWSDPVGEPGFHLNVARGVGMCFGPDVTEVGSCLGVPAERVQQPSL
jgi:serine/threonine-protein phosphatase 5